MEENKYRLAGWLAIVQSILFRPLFIVGIVETEVEKEYFITKARSWGRRIFWGLSLRRLRFIP